MSDGAPAVPAYQVTYSEWVRERLLEYGDLAWRRGDGPVYAAAVKEFHRRLRIYPQFGDPLYDLYEHPGQVRLGVVSPLSMRYGVLEDQRLVIVAALPVLMSRPDPA